MSEEVLGCVGFAAVRVDFGVDTADAVGCSSVVGDGMLTSESMLDFASSLVLEPLVLWSVFMTICVLTFSCMLSVKCFSIMPMY